MADVYTLIEPAVITGIARTAIADEDRLINSFQLSRWFPREFTYEIDYGYQTGNDRTFSESASFRAFDQPPRLGVRPGSTSVRGDLPPIGIEYLIREYDKIKLRTAGRQGDLAADLLPVVSADVVRGVQAVERRFEIFRRDLLIDGKAILSESGLELEMDVQRNPARASTALIGWDDPINATMITDERNIMNTMLRGENIGSAEFVAVMNSVTWQAWLQGDQTRALWDSVRVVPRLTDSQGASVRSAHGLPPVVLNDSQMRNPLTGLTEFIIPDYKVLYLPNFRIGATMYSVPSMADDPDINLEYQERPGPLAYLTREIKPNNTSTVIDALGAPLLQDPDATYAFTAKP